VTTPAAALAVLLTEGRELGFLGPGAIEAHVRHAEGFATVIEAELAAPPSSVVDLGSGAGIPGLVLAQRWSACSIVLVESSQRRASFLAAAVERLAVPNVAVSALRGEEAARRSEWRERFAVVTARSFAAPAVTAEIATGFLTAGGLLVVAEPPNTEPRRWPSAALRELAFGEARIVSAADAHYAMIPKDAATPDRFPRRVGIPGKRPLW
jgi:16S rRNA (guanine527-N7)-methyltransferase